MVGVGWLERSVGQVALARWTFGLRRWERQRGDRRIHTPWRSRSWS
jgi:hypothetical protein